MKNYTGHGWEGSNYKPHRNITDIAKEIKKIISQKYPQCSFSVRTERYSGGQSLYVSLMKAPWKAIVKTTHGNGYMQVNHYYLKEANNPNGLNILTNKAIECLLYINEIMQSYRQNDSDGMIDYFDTNFYGHIEIGAWDKPFVEIEPTQEKQIESVNTSEIQEFTHTKKGFQMFLVQLSERVEREEYLRLLDLAKSLNGWYSRKWENTPAGFAFKSRGDAEKFAEYLKENKPETISQTEKPIKPIVNIAPKLRSLADKMQTEIDNKFGDRLSNTPKRMREAACARLEGEQLQRTQTVLYTLANMYDTGNVPDILKSFTTKKSIYDLMYSKKTNSGGYYDAPICTGKPYYETPESLALWALLTPKTTEELEAEELKRQIEKLRFSNIPGYFPTPEPITAKMIQYADLAEYQDIMEPSAGSGNIIKAIDKTGFNYGIRLAIEYNCTLSSILSKSCKKWDVHQGDFLEQSNIGYYDRILQNPPFNNGEDILHIKHAMTFLKPGGRLVALCANGPRQQDQLQPLADHWEVLPEGSFKQAGTNINVALLIINN